MPENPAKIANAMYVQPSPHWMVGQRYAHRAIVLGILSLFFLGIFLGPAAVRQARKAEAMNVVAVFGSSLGMAGTCVGALSTVMLACKLFAPDSVRDMLDGLPSLLAFFWVW